MATSGNAKCRRICLGVFVIASFTIPLCAQITADNQGGLIAETQTLRAQFLSGSMISLTNKVTGEQYVRQAGPNWITVFMAESLESKPMVANGNWTVRPDASGGSGAFIRFREGERSAEIQVAIDPATDELIVRFGGASSTAGVQSVQWGVFGLDLDDGRLVIPGQAGTYYGKNTMPEFVGLDYPTHWESQFVVYENRKGSLLVYAHEPKPNFKRLHASRGNGNLDFGFEIFAVAPWETARETPALELRWKGFEGDWRAPARYYKDWWAASGPRPTVAANAKRYDGDATRSAIDLEWTREIYSVITILYLDIGALEPLSKQTDPRRTLLHIVPWRKDGFDINYPDYTPAADAKPFIEKAKELGFRIMLHTNALGISETNPNYERFKPLQLKTPNTRELVGWLWDLEPGHIRRLAYINPASSEYRKLFIESIRPAIEELKPDALHLDAGGTIQNDGNGIIEGMNTIQGLIRYQQDLQEAFPGLALGYESITEINSPFISFAQRWSSDSPAHPVATFLFGSGTRSYGFLDQPAPDEDEFIDYLRRYEGQGIIPTAPLASSDDLQGNRRRMQRLIEQLRMWQQYQFEPDWEAGWDGAIFRFRSRDGNHTASIEEKDNVVTLVVDGKTLYQRVRGVTSKQDERYILNWPGYGPNGLVGLNPNHEYWLEEDVKADDDIPHLTDVPDTVHITNQSFLNKDFALLSLDINSPRNYSFTGEFARAKKGTFYRGFGDFALINGAVLTTSPVFVGNRARNSAIVMHPPFRRVLGGVTFTEFTVTVPTAPEVEFQFEVALADQTDRQIPAVFAVWVNGEEQWRRYYAVGRWHAHAISLNRWRGQTVRLRLLGGPSTNGNAIRAISCWSNLKIVSMPRRPGTTVQLALPGGQAAAYSEGIQLQQAADQKVASITVDVPKKFVVFAKEPIEIPPTVNLLDLPFVNFRSAYGSMPSPYSTDWNGVVRDWTSSGILLARALFIQPPTEGRIYSSWAVKLSPEIRSLKFVYGLMHPLPIFDPSLVLYSGATFHIYVNGEEVFDAHTQRPGNNDGSVDLSKWAGKPVLIQLAVDSDGTAIFDWGFFSNVIVSAE